MSERRHLLPLSLFLGGIIVASGMLYGAFEEGRSHERLRLYPRLSVAEEKADLYDLLNDILDKTHPNTKVWCFEPKRSGGREHIFPAQASFTATDGDGGVWLCVDRREE